MREPGNDGALRKLSAVAVLVVAACQASGAEIPTTGGQRIIHEVWTFKDGAPEIANAFAQTSEGYLWVGAPAGLFRFDGVRFELFRSPFAEQLQSTNVRALFAPASGGLWVGYQFGGFSFIKNGRVRNFVERTGSVLGFAEDRHGILWAGTMRGLLRFDGSLWQYIGAGWDAPEKPAAEVGFDREGRLWVLAGARGFEMAKQLFFLPPGGKRFRKAGDHIFVVSFTWDADHTILTTHEGRPREPDSGIEWESSLPAYPILKKNSDQILDRANNIWVFPSFSPLGRPPSLLRHAAGEPLADIVSKVSPGNSEVYDINYGLWSRMVDREGSIWIGGATGVHRLSSSPLIEQEVPKRPGNGPYFTLAPDEGGVVWINAGNNSGSSTLYRVADGKVTSQRSQGGVSNFAYRAPDKTFWFGGEGGLWHMVNGSLTQIELPQEMARAKQARYLATITQDRTGGMWVSFGPVGLYRLKDGVWTKYGGRHDLPTSGVVIEFTDVRGRVWYGCTKNELAVLDGDRVQTFGAKDGVQAGNITAIYGRGSDIWIGGEFGIQQFDGIRFHTIHAVDKESLRGVSGIVETANGDLWLNGLGGIVHVRQAEILRALKNPAYPVSGERFDRRAGLPGQPSQLRWLPTAMEGADGRLWFTVNNGVVRLDPARASSRIPPPPVTIQSVSADDKGYELEQPLRFPARTSSVQISYAAVSLMDPEAIHFRYKLLETDKDWHEAGTSNSVSYRNLSPGSYHFVVGASDANGLWSDHTATTEFTVLPAFYQTTWFRAIMAAVLVALLWAAYRFRMWQVQRETRQLREVIETIPAYVWSALPDGSVDFVNQRWLEFSGFSRDQALGWGWADAVHPEDRARLVETWRAAIASGDAMEAEARMRSADGQYRWLLFRSVPLRDRSGRIVKWYGKSMDIEDLKRAEQERERLRQLEADLAHINRVSMMGELAASVAHEVNQPLTGIVSNGSACIRLLAGQSPNVEEALEALRDIVRDGKRAGEVIARIRAMTKRAATPREPLDLNDVVREVLVLVGDEAKKRSVVLRTEFADGLASVMGDRVQLQQVVLNLVMNAMEAMSSVTGRARELVIHTRNVDGGQVQVTVEDSGVGLDPNTSPKIFEPFYTTKSSGMGMGLSICRSIVQNHGGRLWVTANDGPGTRFHFSLPEYDEEEQNARVRGV